jgi:hypothetical protein
MNNFLQDVGFDEYKANFITNYSQEFKIFDVLQLKDFETILPEASLSRFWPGLTGINTKKFKSVIAWAKAEYETRLKRGHNVTWDGKARVDIENFRHEWCSRNVSADYKVWDFKFE